MTHRWVLLLLAVAAVSVGAACQTARCTPETCVGCCDSAGECVGGNQPSSCGVSGAACTVCTSGERCSRGACVQGGGASGGGASGGGASGGAPAGGAAGGGDPFAGTLDAGINDVIGQRCQTHTRESAECPLFRGVRLDCAPVVTVGGAASVCKFVCEADGGCAGGRGECVFGVWGGGVCQDCIFRCTGADGGRNDCEANERCASTDPLLVTGSFCAADCRLRGNSCVSGSCQANGTCSLGRPAFHCMRY